MPAGRSAYRAWKPVGLIFGDWVSAEKEKFLTCPCCKTRGKEWVSAQVEDAGEKQIPCGDESQKSNGKNNRKCNGRSRFPAGMTARDAKARAKATGKGGSKGKREIAARGGYPLRSMPSFFQMLSMRVRVVASMESISGQGRVKPSPAHLRVASMPILEP